jgi:hypothetical protein
LLGQKASIALPDNEFVEAEIKLPAGGTFLRKCGAVMLAAACNDMPLSRKVLAIAQP